MQFGQEIEGIEVVEPAEVDETHEDAAGLGAVSG